jgi:methylase of polypeptide subunit release factors
MPPTPAPLVAGSDFPVAVRECLDAAGYDQAGILRQLGAAESVTAARKDLPRLLRRTAARTPLDVFIELFMFGTAVPEDAVAGAVAPCSVDDWCRGGLLRRTPQGLLAPLRLVPQAGVRIAFDPPKDPLGPTPPADHVPGPGRITLDLLHGTIRAPVGRALDLGTGSGIQALLCAGHAEEVVATDVNPRALELAAFNVRLAGLDHVTLRAGSLFEPVAGERFDLMVSNPPFAISPDERFVYRDGGRPGDGFVRELLASAGDHLAPHGVCQLMAQWATLRDAPGEERIAGWLEGQGCDVLAVEVARQEPEIYAANWIDEGETLEPEAYRQRWETWMRWFEAQGIVAIHTGLLTLRPTERGAPRIWLLDGVEGIGPGAGALVANNLAVRRELAQRSDAELLGLVVAAAPGIALEEASHVEGGAWKTESLQLRRSRGLPAAGGVGPDTARLVGLADGTRPLGELALEVLGAAAGDTGAAAAAASVVPIARDLLERGFLVPGAPGQSSAA